MVENHCPKCNVYGTLGLDESRGTHIGLVCNNCRSWIKWVGKKELPMYQQLLSGNRGNSSKVDNFERNLRKAIQELGISREEVINMINNIYN